MALSAQTLTRPRAWPIELGIVLAGAALLAASAQIRVPMWPVPMTMQTLAVLLLGAGLGPMRGMAAVATYLAAGLVGLPVFAGGAVGGPSFGYLIGFALAAGATGALVQAGWARGLRLLAALLAGEVLIYVAGLAWLDFVWLHDAGRTIAGGLLPFIPGDSLKLALAFALLHKLPR